MRELRVALAGKAEISLLAVVVATTHRILGRL
jgi:hypothetical protein